MNEQKMREALERIIDFSDSEMRDGHAAREVAAEALAQQPAAVVELTDAEPQRVFTHLEYMAFKNAKSACESAASSLDYDFPEEADLIEKYTDAAGQLSFLLREIEAAHEAKKNGGGG